MENHNLTETVNTPEIVHVAIAPPTVVGEDLITEVTSIINKEPYETRLLLAGRSPRIIAHYTTLQIAESVVQRLRKLGLVVLMFRDSELPKTHSPTFKGRLLKFGEGEWSFQDQSGAMKTMKPEDVFLILRGVRQIYSDKEISKTKTKLNLPATLLTGGIPIRRKVEEKTVETSIQTEHFMRLYLRNSPEPYLEITQYGFDYSCLGKNMSTTTLVNFNNLISKIKELCTRSVFDDSLSESSRGGQDNSETRCKLIYLFHGGETNSRTLR
jgi:hypothetical protein